MATMAEMLQLSIISVHILYQPIRDKHKIELQLSIIFIHVLPRYTYYITQQQHSPSILLNF